MVTFMYPVTAENGTLKLVANYEDKIPQVIKHIVQTHYEERVMRPDFGIEDIQFRSVQDLPSLLRSIEASLSEGLAEYEGVSFSLTAYVSDDGLISVEVFYDIDGNTAELTVVIT